MKHFAPPIAVRGRSRAGLPPWTLAAPFAVALVLRLAMVPRAGLYHPDELFQYLEQAHRLLFGQGVVPWEYRYGMRSWLLPTLIAGPMALGAAIAPKGVLYLLLPRAAMATASLTLVWTAWDFGRRRSPLEGVIAAAITAVWAEFVYFAPHVLSETLSLALILPAAALSTAPGRDARGEALAGLLLGLAALLRLQHLPAIATLLLCTPRPTSRRALSAGMAAALMLGAGIDLAMGARPFAWAIEYVRQNLLLGRAAAYGIASPLAYPQAFFIAFGAWLWPMLLFAAVAMRRTPILARIALANLLFHMAIGHKEYRFVLLSTASFALLAALGSGSVVAATIARWPGLRRAAPAAMLLAWGIASVAIAVTGRPRLHAALDARDLDLFDRLRGDIGLCGLATHGLHFSAGGGYAYLHRAVPIYSYAPGEGAALRADATGFNRLVAPAFVSPPPGFVAAACQPGRGEVPTSCIFTRPGACRTIGQAHEINHSLIRLDQ